MPNIELYTATAEAQPDDKGIQASEVAGRRLGVYGNQLKNSSDQLAAAVDQHETNMEVSHGSAVGATAYSGFTTSLNEVVRNADPNDQSAIPKWKEEVFEPWAQQFVSAFKTKGGEVWARNYVDSMRQHFTEAAIADQSTMAGIAAHQNWQQTVVGLTSTTYQDHTALNATLAALDAQLEYLKHDPALSARDLAAIEDSRGTTRSQIAEAAVRGQIQNGDIDGARKFLNSPEAGQLMSGDTISTLAERADHQEQLNQERAEHLQAAAQRQQVLELKQQAVALQTRISDAIADHGALTPAEVKQAHDQRDALVNNPLAGEVSEINGVNELLRQSARPDAAEDAQRTNPLISADLINRLTVAADQPGAITEAELLKDFKDGSLSKEDYGNFRQALPKVGGDPVLRTSLSHLKTWQEQFHSAIAPPGSVAGAIAYTQFVHDSTFQFMNWYKQDPAHAYDIITNAKNPRSFVATHMIDAYARAGLTSDPVAALSAIPGYGHLAGVQPTAQEGAMDKIRDAGPIKPGESWTAYKARAGL